MVTTLGKLEIITTKEGDAYLCTNCIVNGGLKHFVLRKIDETKPLKVKYSNPTGQGADGGTLFL